MIRDDTNLSLQGESQQIKVRGDKKKEHNGDNVRSVTFSVSTAPYSRVMVVVKPHPVLAA